jgi:predicted alpha/beta-hydrolase family hydrolase
MEAVEFTVECAGGKGRVGARLYSPPADRRPGATLILAHGAGAPQTHPFMVAASRALAARGLTVVTFNFPYMDEGRRVPDRAPVLERTWLDVLTHVASRTDLSRPCFVGGKSMGGRIASHVVAGNRRAELAMVPAGVVFLGYPLHPPGKPQQRRDAHLATLVCPALFVQGSRDAFGTPEELAPVIEAMAGRAALHVVEQADHAFSVPRAAGRPRQDVLDEVWTRVASWIEDRAQRW